MIVLTLLVSKSISVLSYSLALFVAYRILRNEKPKSK